mgnify:FL=1
MIAAQYMNKADKIYRKIKSLSKTIAALSAYKDEHGEWWGHDTTVGNLPHEIQRLLSKHTDWLQRIERQIKD